MYSGTLAALARQIITVEHCIGSVESACKSNVHYDLHALSTLPMQCSIIICVTYFK